MNVIIFPNIRQNQETNKGKSSKEQSKAMRPRFLTHQGTFHAQNSLLRLAVLSLINGQLKQVEDKQQFPASNAGKLSLVEK